MSDPRTTRLRWRRVRIVGLALFVCGLVGLVALEFALRAQGYGVRPALYFDAEVGYRSRPNQERWMLVGEERGARLTTNALGFRGEFPHPERTPSVPRIVAIGDSFTFGLGAEDDETYPAQLGAHLGRVEVLNLSFPGWNVENALLAYRAIGAAYRPDVVVLGFTLDDLRPRGHGMRYTDSPLFRLGWRTAIGEYVQNRLLPRVPGYRILGDAELAALRRGYARAEDRISRNPTGELGRPYLERALGALTDLERAVAASGGRFVVLALPARWQVTPLRALPAGAERDARRAELTRMQAAVRARCAELGVPFLDVLDVLVEAEEDPFAGRDPSHPDARGYRRIAESVGDALLAAGLLER